MFINVFIIVVDFLCTGTSFHVVLGLASFLCCIQGDLNFRHLKEFLACTIVAGFWGGGGWGGGGQKVGGGGAEGGGGKIKARKRAGGRKQKRYAGLYNPHSDVINQG